ncbi:centromere protein U isoform X2 [Latimeria chalumnae]|nr:PREDICTED: centromere protein U [Latimeria chalumnae]|eukprot:XP_014351571.1 PREDICTED: centromere protein U [Latimeria chalumnae]
MAPKGRDAKSKNVVKKKKSKKRLEKILENEDESPAIVRGDSTEAGMAPTRPYSAKSPQPQPRKILVPAEPNVSYILRTTDTERNEDRNESYDHPLHSTAVFTDTSEEEEEEHRDETEGTQQKASRMNKNRKGENWDLSGASESKESGPSSERFEDEAPIQDKRKQLKKTSNKKKSLHKSQMLSKPQAQNVGAPDEAQSTTDTSTAGTSVSRTPENETAVAISSLPTETPSSKKVPSPAAPQTSRSETGRSLSSDEHRSRQADETARKPVSGMDNSLRGKKRKKSLHPVNSDASVVTGPSSQLVWDVEGIKRSSNEITELDVVLTEFEKMITKYKETVDSNICRKAIEKFFRSFKEQLITTLQEVQQLKNLKRKNAKLTTNLNKKRQRLLEVKDELITKEPELRQLQREHAELVERESDMKCATQFLTELKRLQIKYLSYKNDNPQEKPKYGTSSLPALLLEARGVLGAEKQLQILNTKLEQKLKADQEQNL